MSLGLCVLYSVVMVLRRGVEVITRYTVALHGHAALRVEAEAESVQEANRLAVAKAPKVKYVQSWTPVTTSRLKGPK